MSLNIIYTTSQKDFDAIMKRPQIWNMIKDTRKLRLVDMMYSLKFNSALIFINNNDNFKKEYKVEKLPELKKARTTFEFYIKNYEKLKNLIFDIRDEDKVLLEKYKHVLNEKTYAFPEFGSYDLIHYGRKFTDSLFTYIEDTPNYSPKQINDAVEAVLEKMDKTGILDYAEHIFPQLCHHSDADGYYAPIHKGMTEDIGSSLLLLKELDWVFSTGAIDVLKEIKQTTSVKCIVFSLSKLLYDTVNSITREEIMVFC